ncbi:D-2-hydroxyacid dehydrogenase [Teichococcus oryzae]|uniref:D-2-hydroxyacid dehydrogenase n=1 Tax=Teichococcus oryzae TaxID=1608942 RepID=A0A5B2TFU7_9PROT|nr:D-2-hydroxyacid dehydrogenase [Pseudoroseomonas oryzae]KAA2213372.1 D-2-hydroxyacid dehydrogenase [Pseudoroseomonas oryzae]
MAKTWKGDAPVLCLAHGAYDLGAALRAQGWSGPAKVYGSKAEMMANLADVEALVISGFWTDDILDHAPNLKLVQSISAGTERYGLEALKARGVHLCSGQGVNVNAVSDHAMALLLSLTRRVNEAVLNQRKHEWRGMISNPAEREAELEGSTMVILGLGGIGGRLARLARAFGMRVIGLKRNRAGANPDGIELRGPEELKALATEADVLALTCPLTPETRGIVSAEVLRAMKPSALLINVARGPVVDEAALAEALRAGQIRGAGLDTFVEEPLDPASPLWDAPNTIITPHSAGETQFYERNVIRLLMQNLAALENGTKLVNQVV